MAMECRRNRYIRKTKNLWHSTQTPISLMSQFEPALQLVTAPVKHESHVQPRGPSRTCVMLFSWCQPTRFAAVSLCPTVMGHCPTHTHTLAVSHFGPQNIIPLVWGSTRSAVKISTVTNLPPKQACLLTCQHQVPSLSASRQCSSTPWHRSATWACAAAWWAHNRPRQGRTGSPCSASRTPAGQR